MTAPDPAEVERMARVMALAEGCDPDGTFDDGRGNTEIVWRQYEPYASAAISAGYSRTADTLERVYGAVRARRAIYEEKRDASNALADADYSRYDLFRHAVEAFEYLEHDIAAAIRAAKGEG